MSWTLRIYQPGKYEALKVNFQSNKETITRKVAIFLCQKDLTMIYDSLVDGDEVLQGGSVEMAGLPGDVFKIIAR